MQFTNDQIHRLLIEKITGTIAADDDVAIERLISEGGTVMQQWRQLQQQVQKAAASGFTLDHDADKSWQQIVPLLKPRRAPVFLRAAAAAAIAAAVITGIYFSGHHATLPAGTAKLAARDRNGVTLTMVSGDTLFLARSGTHIYHTGTATIKASENELSYSAQPSVNAWSTLAVPAVLSYKIVLSDSTEVWMNSATRLRFPLVFTGKSREVYIDGEAYFKVAKNKQRPFIVHAQETAIRVTGTEFNVNTYNRNTLSTALVEGSVAATGSNRQVSLVPGMQAIYSPQQGQFRVQAFDQAEVLSWMKGVCYFHNTSLQDLSGLLGRWYNVKVSFDNPGHRTKTFSGAILKHQPVQLFLDNLRMSCNISLELRNGVVHFR